MNHKHTIALALGTLFSGIAAGWWLGTQQHSAPATPATAQKVLYWFDPMKPEQHFDQPGKSPFMDMALVPRYADGSGESSGIRIDPGLIQNTGVKLARVSLGTLTQGIEVPGSVVFNDRDIAIVQARSGGIVERVYPLAGGDVIAAGAPIADIRIPEWLAAQNEYLALRHDAELAPAALSRLLQLGMTQSQVRQLQSGGQPQAVMTITAPRSGMIAELLVRQGMVLTAGAPLARINGLATVWIEAEVPQNQAALVKTGNTIHALFAAWPNTPVSGKITALIPELNKDSRTLRVRAEIPNRQGLLRPGMFAQIALEHPAKANLLLVPSDSVIATGKRKVVILADGKGRFTPAEVQTGQEQNGQTEIVSGLQQNEQIVVSGQFLIDSEASLRGVLARMNPAASPVAAKTAISPLHQAAGIVKAIAGLQITLSHEAIPSLSWPAMTMPFTLDNAALAKGLAPGQRVNFSLQEEGNLIKAISPAGAKP